MRYKDVALILAAALIVAADLKFGRRSARVKQTSKTQTKSTEEKDNMRSALVDLLIEKGIITEEEYEKRIKQRIKIK